MGTRSEALKIQAVIACERIRAYSGHWTSFVDGRGKAGNRGSRFTGELRAVARPELPQIRTCGIPASGSSDYGFATNPREWTILGVGNGIRVNIAS